MSTYNNYTFFWESKSPFSNFHPSPFCFDGHYFFSSEQAFMYQKAKFFNDKEAIQDLLDLNNFTIIKKVMAGLTFREMTNSEHFEYSATVKMAKQIGRRVKNYSNSSWDKVRYFKMKEILRIKFHSPDFQKYLNLPKEQKLVEVSPYDKIWGIGLSENDAKKVQPDNWPGRNLLGQILTELKNEIFYSDSNPCIW